MKLIVVQMDLYHHERFYPSLIYRDLTTQCYNSKSMAIAESSQSNSTQDQCNPDDGPMHGPRSRTWTTATKPASFPRTADDYSAATDELLQFHKHSHRQRRDRTVCKLSCITAEQGQRCILEIQHQPKCLIALSSGAVPISANKSSSFTRYPSLVASRNHTVAIMRCRPALYIAPLSHSRSMYGKGVEQVASPGRLQTPDSTRQ